ncbi:MAG: type IV-A pilus assembly ATPase PilB [Gemmatimonadota bacterium]|nr:MAG: type IV-A pilus assembly ATPase PilB [Gemmatimonadota bacterium]
MARILKLGEMLVQDGRISEVQLEKALDRQERQGGTLGTNLTDLGFITEQDLLEYLSKQLGVQSVDLSEKSLDPDIVGLLPSDVIIKFKVLPLEKSGRRLLVAMADPTNFFLLDALKFLTGCTIEARVATDSAIQKAIEKLYDTGDSYSEVMRDVEDLEVLVETKEEEDFEEVDLESAVQEAPLVRLVNSLIIEAIRKGASDIHLEPFEKVFRVRYRIDGTLIEMPQLPYRLKPAVTSRLKIMASLNIAERRIPQDGRIKIRLANKTVDLRVSTLPTVFGEKVVMRILDSSNLTLDLTKLGFQMSALQNFVKAVKEPYGIVLVTGPTGSGKTTTLYSALSMLNTVDTNIMTAEDPVEYNLPGINQVQVRPEVGLNFASSLRSFLRQDPNIIMVGEIRDVETGEIAIKAALTGHLVLSTLHTNDAPSTINRLIDMGIAPFLVSTSLNMVIAQRLVRKLCSHCKEAVRANDEMFNELGIDPRDNGDMRIFKAQGCSNCNQTGYKGRLGLYEVMPISSVIRRMIHIEASTEELRNQAVADGMITLRDDALIKFKDGITSFEEVIRETTGK